MKPKVVPMPLFGAERIGVLVKLMNSARNSKFRCSVTVMNLETLTSASCRAGPRNVPTPQVPKVPAAAGATVAGLNHAKPPPKAAPAFVPGVSLGEAIQLARGKPVTTPELFGP